MPMTAQNLVKGNYGYLYCHMSDKGELTAYAISRDGYNYQDINGGNPIFNPEEHARTMARATSWLPPICACARVTNGTTMVSIS